MGKENNLGGQRGKKHSPEGKAAIGAANRGKKRTHEQRRDMSKESRGIWDKILPFLVRGVSVVDIKQITGFDSKQIARATKKLRKIGIIPPLTAELLDTTRRKAQQVRQHGYTQEEQRDSIFVASLQNAGLITENLTYWDRLHELYTYYERELPASLPSQIAAEAYLAASLHIHVGRVDVYIAYMRVAESSGYGFAKNEEEKFIEEKINRAVVTRKKS